MKQIYLCCLFLLVFFELMAQTATITGKVQAVDGRAISQATVRLQDANIASVSNDSGYYELSGVPYGKHQMLITSVEINQKKLQIEVDKPVYELNIPVVAKGDISVDEVRVMGNSVKREIESSGFAVNVIETKEASLRSIQTNELLDRTVGVRVRQSGGLGSEVQYNLNGMTGRSVGIFIDGIEISTYGSSFNLNSIPPSMIERIEVYKGVLPAHLTGDLLGGAINIVLKKGYASNNLSASLSYGSFNTMQADLSALYRNAKTGFTTRVSGTYLNTDNDYEIWGKFSKYIEPNGVVQRNYRTKRFFDGYKSISGRFEFGFTDVSWADAFFVGYNVSDAYKEIQHGQTMGTPYKGRTSDANAQVLSLNYTKKDLITPGLNASINAVYSFRNTYIQDTVPWAYNWDGNIRLDLNGNPIRRADGAQQGKPSLTDIDRQIANIRTNLSYDVFAGHRLSINHVFYTIDRKDKNRLNPVGIGGLNSANDLSKNVISFNYEALTLNDRLTTNLFYKVYQQSIGNTSYTGVVQDGQTSIVANETKDNRKNHGYGIAASYRISPKIVLLASAEHAVRMPEGSETFGSPEDNVIANPGISPEVSDNFNTGLRVGVFEFQSHKVSASANVFWRNSKDRIMARANDMLNSQEIELTQYVNLGLAQSVGFEGELSYSYKDKLLLNFNLSKFNSLFKQEFDPTSGQPMTYYNKQIPNEPFYTMNGNINYRLDDIFQKSSQLNLFYTLGYVAPFSTIWPESDWFITPKQYAQNLGVSYVFPAQKFVLSLDVKNLFNAELYDNFGVQKPGRGFYVKLNYSLNKR